jgi:hypothetical protein
MPLDGTRRFSTIPLFGFFERNRYASDGFGRRVLGTHDKVAAISRGDSLLPARRCRRRCCRGNVVPMDPICASLTCSAVRRAVHWLSRAPSERHGDDSGEPFRSASAVRRTPPRRSLDPANARDSALHITDRSSSVRAGSCTICAKRVFDGH